jgi:hypothetical protein
LKAAGAARVTALTLARVDHRSFSVGSERRRFRATGCQGDFATSSASASAGGQKTQAAGLGAK